jgi:hypothetical protein
MAQQISIKNYSRKNYFNWDALKSENPPKSIKVSFYSGKMTPLNWPQRVDIESPHWHDTKESDGSTNFN